MFTIDQILSAHSKVKSGADFPAYIRDLKKLGVTSYTAFVRDGHTEYCGTDDFKAVSHPKYETLEISQNVNADVFKSDLKTHQQGQSDYLTFCGQAAKSGVEKWTCDLEEMTCVYFDGDGNEVLAEQIPA